MKFGAFPEIFLLENKENFKLILQSYSKNILYQDIAPRFEIKKLRDLEKLYIYFLSNYGNLYSYNKLSKIFDINDKTIKEYIRYFQEAFLLYEIEKFDYSLKKQLVNDKKVYISDLGFINAISFKFSEDKGRLLENLVFIELKRREYEIYYHKAQKECDFVVKSGLEITRAIQVTKSLENFETKKREIAGLLDACKSYKLNTGLILTEDEEGEEIAEYKDKEGNKFQVKIQIQPVWKWLLVDKQETD